MAIGSACRVTVAVCPPLALRAEGNKERMRTSKKLRIVFLGSILALAIALQGCAGEEEAPTPAPAPPAEPCVQQAARQAEQIETKEVCTDITSESPCNAASGCTWTGSTCEEVCTDITSESPCNAASGCTWTGSTCEEIGTKKSSSSSSSSSSSDSSSSSSSSSSSKSSSSSSATSSSSSDTNANSRNANVAEQSSSSSQSSKKSQTRIKRHVTYTVTRTETLEHLKEEVAHEAQRESAAITMEAASTAALDKKLGEEATRLDRITKIAREEDEARKLEVATLDKEMDDMNQKLLKDEKERRALMAQLQKALGLKEEAYENKTVAEERYEELLARIANTKVKVRNNAEETAQTLKGLQAEEQGQQAAEKDLAKVENSATSLVQADVPSDTKSTELLGAFAIAGKSLLQEASNDGSSASASKETQTTEGNADLSDRDGAFAVEVRQRHGSDAFVELKSKEQGGPRARRAALQEK